jgi:hypothetical protein
MITDPTRTKEKLDAIAASLSEAADAIEEAHHSLVVAVNNLKELAEYYK